MNTATASTLWKVREVLSPYFPGAQKATFRKFEVLLYIFLTEETSSPDIQTNTGTSQASASLILKDLSVAGLVETYMGSGADRKRQLVALTDKGRELRAKVLDAMNGG